MILKAFPYDMQKEDESNFSWVCVPPPLTPPVFPENRASDL